MSPCNIIYVSPKERRKAMTPRTGRPTDNPKRHETRIRMSDEDVELLEYCCNKTGKTKADIIREGIRKVYYELKNK